MIACDEYPACVCCCCDRSFIMAYTAIYICCCCDRNFIMAYTAAAAATLLGYALLLMLLGITRKRSTYWPEAVSNERKPPAKVKHQPTAPAYFAMARTGAPTLLVVCVLRCGPDNGTLRVLQNFIS